MVDENLASYADTAFNTALVLYALAMVLHAIDFAWTVARPAGATSATPGTAAAAAAGGSGVLTLNRLDTDESTVVPTERSRSERAGRAGVALTVVAAAVHAASLTLRGLAVDKVPWSNMYEFTSMICFAAIFSWLVVLGRSTLVRRPATIESAGTELRRLGVFVLTPVIILLFLAGTVLYADAEPLIPALNSYWIAIHVSAASVASGVLLVAGVASVLYLLAVRAQGQPAGTSRLSERLPSAEVLDRLAYRTTVVAFPIWTFGIITGAIWAEAAWGRYWGWDPKETVALVAWVVYACYLHARATAGWRGTRSAAINVFGLSVMLFNLFFINIVVAGLHSYAGV